MELNKDIRRVLDDYYTPRLGKVFSTENRRYFYDTGTGKIAEVNENVYFVLKTILENGKSGELELLNLSPEDGNRVAALRTIGQK